MNVRIKPYLKMWGSERDWERIWMVTRPRNNHIIHHILHKKTFFFQAKNLRKNLRLREKFEFKKFEHFLFSLYQTYFTCCIDWFPFWIFLLKNLSSVPNGTLLWIFCKFASISRKELSSRLRRAKNRLSYNADNKKKQIRKLITLLMIYLFFFWKTNAGSSKSSSFIVML